MSVFDRFFSNRSSDEYRMKKKLEEYLGKNDSSINFFMENLKSINALEGILYFDPNYINDILLSVKSGILDADDFNILTNMVKEERTSLQQLKEKYDLDLLEGNKLKSKLQWINKLKALHDEQRYAVDNILSNAFILNSLSETLEFDDFINMFSHVPYQDSKETRLIFGDNLAVNRIIENKELLDKEYLMHLKEKGYSWVEYYRYFIQNGHVVLPEVCDRISKRDFDILDMFVELKIDNMNIRYNQIQKELYSNFELNKDMKLYYAHTKLGIKPNKMKFFQSRKSTEYDVNTSEIDILQILLDDIDYTNILETNPEFLKKHGQTILDIQTLINITDPTETKQRIDDLQTRYEQKEKNFGECVYILEEDYKKEMQKQFVEDVRITDKVETTIREDDQSHQKYEIKEFKGEDFTMLINVLSVSQGVNDLDPFNRKGKSSRIAASIINNSALPDQSLINNMSLSLIDQDFLETYTYDPNQDLILGYENIDPNNIIMTKEMDVGINNTKSEESLMGLTNRKQVHLPNTATVTSVKHILDLSKKAYDEENNQLQHNEIDILTKNLKPSYVVCFNEIRTKEKNFAEKNNIPIYVIHTDYYAAKGKNK